MKFKAVAIVTLASLFVSTSSAWVLKKILLDHSAEQKVAQSEMIVTGKVTAIEANPVQVKPHEGATDKVSMKVAVIKVEKLHKSEKQVTHVRVLFRNSPIQPTGLNRAIKGQEFLLWDESGDLSSARLEVGVSGIFFLSRHPTSSEYQMAPQCRAILDDAPNAKEEREKIESLLAILKKPIEHLQAAKAEDRITATLMLIQNYRHQPSQGKDVREVAIPAQETQLILKALSEADWNARPSDRGVSVPGVSTQLGWNRTPNGQEIYYNNTKVMAEAYQTWYKAKAKDFVIKKFVRK